MRARKGVNERSQTEMKNENERKEGIWPYREERIEEQTEAKDVKARKKTGRW